MGATEPNYADRLLAGIAAGGYRHTTKVDYVDVALPKLYRVRGEAVACTGAETSPPCAFTSFGRYAVDRFEKTVGNTVQRVVVVTYFWNDSMAELQRGFLQRDRTSRTGAKLNTTIKRNLIDDGFGDATAYLGEAGRLARLGIAGALCSMLRDAADPFSHDGRICNLSELTDDVLSRSAQAQYSFLSFSLGSRMLYDVLSAMREPATGTSILPPKAFARFVARTHNFFMAANQMPLLGIGSITVREQSAAAPRSMFSTESVVSGCDGGFFNVVACVRSRKAAGSIGAASALSGENVLSDDLQVIAFHDPADLLGFRASGGMQSTQGIDFVEVAHRNTPVVLGLLALPTSAHAKELERRDSLALILCGGHADASGKLHADSCR
jgi:hypothetical protein